MLSFSSILRLTLAVAALHSTFTAAMPIDNSGNTYGGNGGDSSGGSVIPTEHKSLTSLLGPLLRIGSGNGGCGGKSKSVPTIGGSRILGLRHFMGGASNSGNVYGGDGGPSKGGNVTGSDSLIDLDSGNGGCGGDSSSGATVGGAQGDYREDYPGDSEHGGNDRYDDGEGCDSC